MLSKNEATLSRQLTSFFLVLEIEFQLLIEGLGWNVNILTDWRISHNFSSLLPEKFGFWLHLEMET